MTRLKQGAELFEAARERLAAARPEGLVLRSEDWSALTIAIAEAYLQGGIDILADEIEAKSALPKT